MRGEAVETEKGETVKQRRAGGGRRGGRKCGRGGRSRKFLEKSAIFSLVKFLFSNGVYFRVKFNFCRGYYERRGEPTFGFEKKSRSSRFASWSGDANRFYDKMLRVFYIFCCLQ